MVAQSRVSSASPSEGENDTSRLHIRSIKEMPAGHDQELAIIFSEMRRATTFPREKMAERLGTSNEILGALESGALFALPPWPELSRIVTSYAKLLGLDSRPLLRRLEAQLSPDEGLVEASPAKKITPVPAHEAPKSAPATVAATQSVTPTGLPMPPSAAPPAARPVAPRPVAIPPPPAVKPPVQPSRHAKMPGESAQPQYHLEDISSLPPEVEAPEKRLSGVLIRVFKGLVLLSFIAALGAGVWYAAQRPQMVWSAVDKLPDPVPQVVRSAWKFMRPLESKSIGPQITNPDSRKSDKLPKN